MNLRRKLGVDCIHTIRGVGYKFEGENLRSSLSVKVFLLIAGSLLFCSFIIYGSIMLFLPESYVAVIIGTCQYGNSTNWWKHCLKPKLESAESYT